MSKRKKKGKWIDRPERDRLAFEVLRAIRGVGAEDIARQAQKAGFSVSGQSVRNLRADPKTGGTRFPQSYTLQAMLAAVGKGFGVVEASETRTVRKTRASASGSLHLN